MALIVETGAGLSTANGYVTEAEYRAHHGDRGVDVTAQVTATVEAALVNATDYVDKRFGKRFRGYRRQSGQALEWPRIDAYDDDEILLPNIPLQLKKAVAEYAWLATQIGRNLAPMPGAVFPMVDPTTGVVINQGGGTIRRKTEKVDTLEETHEYSNYGQVMTTTGNILTQHVPEYPQADMWLEELLHSERMLGRG